MYNLTYLDINIYFTFGKQENVGCSVMCCIQSRQCMLSCVAVIITVYDFFYNYFIFTHIP